MAELETRRMGRTGMRPKSLALGAAWLHQCPEDQAVKAIRRALELGIDYFDTYPGHQEHRWAKAFEGGWREKIYLQAKVGTHPERRKDFTAEGTRWSVENSLRELKTDYLDAVLIHDPVTIEDPLGANRALDELLKMKEQGTIRAVGLGCRQHDFHQAAIETGHIDIVLTFRDYTLLSQIAAQTTLPLASQYDVGLILAMVLAGGMAGPEPERERDPEVHTMWQWCQERGYSLRDFAIQFCLAAPIDGVVMVGVSDEQQVEEAFASATRDIPEGVWQAFCKAFGIGTRSAEVQR